VLFIGTPLVTLALSAFTATTVELSCDTEEMRSLIQPQNLTDLSSRVSAPLDVCHLDSPALPAYPSWTSRAQLI
jgi:hypothetical protein